MSTEPVPQRLSDADRDQAATLLREHFAAGRLGTDELDERLGSAIQARFAAELEPLFADLPEPHPDVMKPSVAHLPTWANDAEATPHGVAPRHPSTLKLPDQIQGFVPVARRLVWPVAIAAALISGHWGICIMIAIIASVVLSQFSGPRRTPPPYDPRELRQPPQ